MVITFSFVDVTGTSDSVEWIEGDPFCQTRVGNETNPFVQNADVSVHEDCNDEFEFNERLVLISKSKAEFICFICILCDFIGHSLLTISELSLCVMGVCYDVCHLMI